MSKGRLMMFSGLLLMSKGRLMMSKEALMMNERPSSMNKGVVKVNGKVLMMNRAAGKGGFFVDEASDSGWNRARSEPPLATMDSHNPRYVEAGAIYGLVYYSDGASVPTPRRNKRRAEIKQNLSRLNASGVGARS